MSKHLFTNRLTCTTGLFLTISLGGCLTLLALFSIRQPLPRAAVPAASSLARESRHQQERENEGTNPTTRTQLQGAAAHKYLQHPGEGQSLGQAIAAARFGLKRQEPGPMGEQGVGYLGMSHVQNVNAWFADEGMTIRPTVAERDQPSSWHLDMRLRAYGYGDQLVVAPPIVPHHVKDNRIEYERAEDPEMRISDFGVMRSNLSLNPHSALRNWWSVMKTVLNSVICIGLFG